MSAILLISVAIRLVAFGWAVALTRRLRDRRVGLMALMLALMALRQALSLVQGVQPGGSWWPRFGVATIEVPGLVVSVIAFVAVVLLARVLDEQRAANEALRRQAALEAHLRHAQKMEAVGQLAGGVAHDFNNLLAVVVGLSADLLETLPPDAPARGPIGEIARAGDRAAALTRQLLHFSRQEPLRNEVIDPNRLLTELGPMLLTLVGERYRLRLELGAGVGAVRGDPNSLEQVVVNLVANARDAMPEGGDITLRTARVDRDTAPGGSHPAVGAGAYCRLSVTDTGPGIAPEALPRLYEPFFTTKPRGRGTGLGLATAYGVVGDLGGTVRVETSPERGTTFELWLPRTGEAAPTPPAPRPSTTPRGSEPVLLVEDDPDVRSLLARVLERQGYAVTTAVDADTALAAVDAGNAGPPPACLVTDVILPGRTGPQLAALLRERWPDLRVLYVSGYAADALPADLGRDGSAFLRKPFAPSELGRAIRGLLDGSRGCAPSDSPSTASRTGPPQRPQ